MHYDLAKASLSPEAYPYLNGEGSYLPHPWTRYKERQRKVASLAQIVENMRLV